MVRPLDMQDNLSKTLLAQEVNDRLLEGAEKAREQSLLQAQKQLATEDKSRISQADEKSGSSRIRGEDKHDTEGRSGRGRKQRGKDDSGEAADEEGVENDLRRRRSDDDSGKGDKLDIVG